jgi:hypothetical protein
MEGGRGAVVFFLQKGNYFQCFSCYVGWRWGGGGNSFTWPSPLQMAIEAGGSVQFLVSAVQVGIILITEITMGGGGEVSNPVFEIVRNGVHH